MEQKSSGVLIVAGLDIGNLEDIPVRTKRALKEADFIVAEHASLMEKHLKSNNIEYSVSMYNYLPDLIDRNERIEYVCKQIESGKKVLLISSEGMPLIHDPGYEIVKEVRKKQLNISVIPGPSAPIAALAVSGLDTWKFIFESDVPENKEQRINQFKEINFVNKTVIYFEKDWQLLDSLKDLADVAGKNRQISICINLTMKDEFIYRGSVIDAINFFNKNLKISNQQEQNKIVLIISQGKYENFS